MRRSSPPGALAVELYGYGRVARALVAHLPKDGIQLATVRDRSGVRLRGPAEGGRTVVVDATSPRYEGEGAEAWVRRLEETLASGTPVVTCNKAPLAIAWSRLARAARSGRTTISCAGTVGGGTPVLLFLRRLHQCHGVERIEAALNATLGYVCSQVAAGVSLPTAIRRAQLAGWAEPDPALDLDGTDAYSKGVIIHNLLFSAERPLMLEDGRPRLRLEEGRIRRLARSEETSQVLSTVTPGHVELAVVGVGAEDLAPDASGLVKVRALLADGSEASISGPGAGAQVTAGALLGDLRALADGGEGRPWGVVP